MVAVVVAQPRDDGRVDEEGMAEPALERVATLDLADDRGVEADAGVEEEVAVVDAAESDAADRVLRERVEEHARGLDRVVREADRPGEDVRRAAGQRGERRLRS